MDNIKAIQLLEYIKTFDNLDFGATKIAIDKGIDAIKKIEKLEKMVKTLETNLSPNVCTVRDSLDDYEKYKYDAHIKCLTHLKEILSDDNKGI